MTNFIKNIPAGRNGRVSINVDEISSVSRVDPYTALIVMKDSRCYRVEESHDDVMARIERAQTPKPPAPEPPPTRTVKGPVNR